MKINHLLFLGLLAGFLSLQAVTASAQRSNSDININVSAKVISTIEMITIQSMKLSQVEAVNDIIRINPQNSTYAGKIIAIGTPNSDMRISFLEQRELTHNRSSDNLIFNYQVAGNSQDDQSSAEQLERENRDLKFNSNGRYYLWIGGSVDISTANPGSYRGEFTLEIEYI